MSKTAIVSLIFTAIVALLIWIGMDHGWWVAALGFAGFISMFRNPLRYFWNKARGQAA